MKHEKKPQKGYVYTFIEIPDVIAHSECGYYCSGDHIGISDPGGQKCNSGSDRELSAGCDCQQWSYAGNDEKADYAEECGFVKEFI